MIQVVWRIFIFYIVNLFLIGLIVPADSELYSGEGSTSRFSPFVIAIRLAGIKVLPSIFNAVILIAVMSVANSCTFGSTRTIQALAANGTYIQDTSTCWSKRSGKLLTIVQVWVPSCSPTSTSRVAHSSLPYCNCSSAASRSSTLHPTVVTSSPGCCPCPVSQFCSSMAVFALPTSDSGELGKSSLTPIALHVTYQLRAANGHTLEELPFKAAFGVWGSYVGLFVFIIALVAQFYVALFPVGGDPSASRFFQAYLAGPFLIALYLGWKIYSWFMRPTHRPLWIKTKDIDIYTGMREGQRTMISGVDVTDDQRRASITELQTEKKKGVKGWMVAAMRSVI